MDLLESFSSRRLAMDPKRSKDAGTPSMWWKCRWDTWTGAAVLRSSLLGSPVEVFPSCWLAECFLCRRSPAAGLLTINSPPPSCCGSRQPKVVPVQWTWGAALRDRYGAQPLRSLPMCSEGAAGLNLLTSFADRKGWNSWRVLTPHCQYWPARGGQLNSKLLFDSSCLWKALTYPEQSPACVLGFVRVSSLLCQWSKQAGIDGRRRHEREELKISLFCFQDMENKIRSTLNEIYFGKTKDIVNGLR